MAAADFLWQLDAVSLGPGRLREVSLTIGRGVTAIVGWSGAGKTPRLNWLARFSHARAGNGARRSGVRDLRARRPRGELRSGGRTLRRAVHAGADELSRTWKLARAGRGEALAQCRNRSVALFSPGANRDRA